MTQKMFLNQPAEVLIGYLLPWTLVSSMFQEISERLIQILWSCPRGCEFHACYAENVYVNSHLLGSLYWHVHFKTTHQYYYCIK